MAIKQVQREEHPAITEAINETAQKLYEDILKIMKNPDTTQKVLRCVWARITPHVIGDGHDAQRIFLHAIDIARQETKSSEV